MAQKIAYDDEAKQKAQAELDFEGMSSELKLTEETAAQLDSPIVWSHNDLLSGNVLVSKQVLPCSAA
jgi:ethanolamine kinase